MCGKFTECSSNGQTKQTQIGTDNLKHVEHLTVFKICKLSILYASTQDMLSQITFRD